MGTSTFFRFSPLRDGRKGCCDAVEKYRLFAKPEGRVGALPSFLLSAFFFLFLFCLALPVQAAKKKNKATKQSGEVEVIWPDPISRKAKPDSRPRVVELPNFNASGNARGAYSNHIHGIDVSHYQGSIDWATVARQPEVGYVYLKASEGGNNQDNYYARNIREARRAGLKVGSYHFFRANVGAREQLQNFMAVVSVKQQDLIPIIDVETTNKVSSHHFHSRLKELLRLVTKEFGCKPIIYTGRNFYNKHFAHQGYDDYPFMIAQYSEPEPVLSDGRDYLIWQYSATGSVRGIRGNVDMSRFVGRHDMRDILLK